MARNLENIYINEMSNLLYRCKPKGERQEEKFNVVTGECQELSWC
jgi:hypothetical protein